MAAGLTDGNMVALAIIQKFVRIEAWADLLICLEIYTKTFKIYVTPTSRLFSKYLFQNF